MSLAFKYPGCFTLEHFEAKEANGQSKYIICTLITNLPSKSEQARSLRDFIVPHPPPQAQEQHVYFCTLESVTNQSCFPLSSLFKKKSIYVGSVTAPFIRA